MYFFGLSFGEFLAMFSAASGVVVALYLLDRSRRSVVVATLRFWTHAKRPVESTRRRRIRQWPSLLLQLISIAFLLLALAQLRLGSPDSSSRDHVLILDTSSWMSARDANTILFEDARAQALAYVKAVPSTDRLLVIHAAALATPATSFETDRRKVEQAIRQAQPGPAALNLSQAFDLARSLQLRAARRPGEIVFAGSPRTTSTDDIASVPPNLRLLAVRRSPENVGLRKIGLRHSLSEAGLWHIHVAVRNYGARPHNVDLGIQFAGAPAGTRRLSMNPGAEQEASFEYRTRSAGIMEARIRSSGDAFPGDDRAVLELPAVEPIAVSVCSPEPALFRPLFDSIPNVKATFHDLSSCPPAASGVAIYDRFAPPSPAANAIYIEPPPQRSPIPVRSTSSSVSVERWNLEHPASSGIRAQDLQLASAQILAPGPGDSVLAESASGPVVAAHTGPDRRYLVVGFHPLQSALKFELTTPLLFAKAIRWMAPDGFLRREVFASSVGSVLVPLDRELAPAQIRVLASDNSQLPFSLKGNSLRFFSGVPGTVRVQAGEREQVHSLALPEVAEAAWEPPSNVRRGIPRAHEAPASSRELWYWLAILGGLGLLIEWLLFAPSGIRLPSAAPVRAPVPEESLRRRAS